MNIRAGISDGISYIVIDNMCYDFFTTKDDQEILVDTIDGPFEVPQGFQYGSSPAGRLQQYKELDPTDPRFIAMKRAALGYLL